MPRQSRIDAPSALHHIIVRGIDRKKIFKDDPDRDNFLKRLGGILIETKTPCYAWALLPNHFHLLLRTGDVSISTVMRRLLTSYAIYFNKRHRRSGHLFQNRFKSILCQEDVYLKELVRYIHLNLLRASIVSDLKELNQYKYSGHSVIIGKQKSSWHHMSDVLKLFHRQKGPAKQAYTSFIEKGIGQGKRPELVGGGLVRSAGGWAELKALRKSNIFQKGDERILGNSDFVETVLSSANESFEIKYLLKSKGFTLNTVAKRVASLLNIDQKVVWYPGRHRQIVEARSLLCYWAVRELGLSLVSLSRKLNISVQAVSKSVVRGEQLAKKNRYKLITDK